MGRREPDRLQAMLDRMAHRGPDDEGQAWVETSAGWLGLGSRRLSVLDLSSAGHQPMQRAGRLLAYNGEVYNFVQLRDELARSGQPFVSGTDSEVVLAMLNQYGVQALRRLNGMFALAWWDSEAHELILARDRFGIKPLYYHINGEKMMFASEAKCLFAGGIRAELDLVSLPSYLAFGWVPGDRTMYQGVSELPPGHLMRWSSNGADIEAYRDTVPNPDAGLDRATAAAELRGRLVDAVTRQLVADVPVGVLLSGGLDSTAVAAIAARDSSKPVTAYTITFRSEDAVYEQSADDARFARLASERLGLRLEEIEITPKVVDLLDCVSWHLDDPVADPASVLSLVISQAAAKEVTVLLSGQGSDELLGGYRVHAFHRVADTLERQPRWALRAESSALDRIPNLAKRLPHSARPGLLLAAHRAGRMVLDHLRESPEDRYIAWRSTPYFSDGGFAGLLSPDARAAITGEDPAAVHRRAFAEHPELDFFDRMLFVDFKTFLVSQNLAYSDRLSMAASIEMRVPFLDDRVVDFGLRLPASLKLRGLRGKAVLRDGMKGIVPDEIIGRRKVGFGAPIRGWLRCELQPLVRDTLSARWLEQTGVFEPRVVQKLIDDHVSGAADHTYRLWTLLSFALWWRAHLSPVGC